MSTIINKIKDKIGGDFSTNLLTEGDLATGFKVLLGYFDVDVPPGASGDPKGDIEQQALAQAKMIAHFVQNTAAPKEE